MAQAQAQGSSLLFSLRELEELEHDRISRERAEIEARRAATERARADRETAALQAEARRIEEIAARQTEEDRRRREEAARLSAMERAAVERARAEIETRAAAELATSRRSHELEVERVRAFAARGRYRWLLGASAAAVASIGGFAALVASRLHAMERIDTERTAVAARERDACARTAGELDRVKRHVGSLESELRVLQSRSTAAPPERPSPPAVPRADRPVPRRPGGAHPSLPAAKCTNDGDPLNGCLPVRGR